MALNTLSHNQFVGEGRERVTGALQGSNAYFSFLPSFSSIIELSSQSANRPNFLKHTAVTLSPALSHRKMGEGVKHCLLHRKLG
jgi:hypothetical protein